MQRGVLIEHPKGVAMPFLQPTGLKANLPQVQKQNMEFVRLIQNRVIDLFHPPMNESATRKYTIDNILFQRDDRINFVPNTPKPRSEPTTTQSSIEYSFLKPQSYDNQQQQQDSNPNVRFSGNSKFNYQIVKSKEVYQQQSSHISPDVLEMQPGQFYQPSQQNPRSYVYAKPSDYFNS